jgi:cobalt-zinc-cadmium efflux system outer membrane protein
LAFVGLASAARPARAEEISLSQAMDLFLARNADILASRYEIDKAAADLLGAKLRPNPGLSFNYNAIEFGNGRGVRVGDNTLLALRLDQLLELGGKRGWRAEVAGSALEAAKLAHQDAIRTLLAGFYTLFYTLLLDQEGVDFARDELQRSDKVLEVAEKRYAAGALSLLDEMKLKLSRVDLESDLAAAENQLRDDQEFFGVLLGGDRTYTPARTDDPAAVEDFRDDALVKAAYGARPDLLALRKQLEAAEGGRKLARANAWPNLDVGAEYDSLGTLPQPAFGFGVSLSLPLFNRNQAEILKAGYEEDQLKIRIDKLQRQIAAEVRQALDDCRTSFRILAAYRAREKEMADLLDRTNQAFSRGGTTVLDLLDTRKTHREFMSKLRQAQLKSRLGLALLKIAAGGLA